MQFYWVNFPFFCLQEPLFTVESPLCSIAKIEKIGASTKKTDGGYGLDILCKVCITTIRSTYDENYVSKRKPIAM